ncbi:hypothetical protein EUBHAL_01660 [Anaerobutyricum hallii DSM 3353]|uniref:Uncharacterized protein n=1 Tax=Anaerobutyricum hallii DSM 3353 TaxID=411469 RepID=C0EW71_9FIRM|nr:hypothetical protein EUBHAL_01660 [Anaerobutyricum hallii DSM 3353]
MLSIEEYPDPKQCSKHIVCRILIRSNTKIRTLLFSNIKKV